MTPQVENSIPDLLLDYSQITGALKILHKIAFRLCICETFEFCI
jgi:hypothetical protein